MKLTVNFFLEFEKKKKPTTPTKDSVLFEDSLASVSRAIIGAVYQLHVGVVQSAEQVTTIN